MAFPPSRSSSPVFWSNGNFYVEGSTAGEAMKNFSELRTITICDNWCGCLTHVGQKLETEVGNKWSHFRHNPGSTMTYERGLVRN